MVRAIDINKKIVINKNKISIFFKQLHKIKKRILDFAVSSTRQIVWKHSIKDD